MKYLIKEFPDSLIVREFNHIDLVVMNENLPIEVQSTTLMSKSVDNKISKISGLSHTTFENLIRRQIEDNIENYSRCWFFFDSEYYRYLNETASNISINFDWFAKYVKEDKLKVFTIKYNGEIRELKYEDLVFIRKLSNTCNIEYENDERILNRNKIKIMSSVLTGYNFTQNELDNFMDVFNKRESKNDKFFVQYLLRDSDIRKNTYGNILIAISNLKAVNDILSMNENYDVNSKFHSSYLGIFNSYGKSVKSKIQFVDKFDICKCFPGYMKNKEKWNFLKEKVLSNEQLKSYFWTNNNTRIQKKLEF